MMEKILRISKFFLLLLLLGCVNNDIVINDDDFNNIVNQIYVINKNQNASIDFNKVIPVKWDKMYIIDADNFPEISSREEISELIGAKYSGPKNNDSDRSVIFVKNKKVVYEIFSDFKSTSWSDNKYFINFSINSNIYFFTPQKGIFFIQHKTDKDEGFNLISKN